MSGEGRAGLSQVPRKQDREQRGIMLVDEGSHSMLNHPVCRSWKISATRDADHQSHDVSQEIAVIAARKDDEGCERVKRRQRDGRDEVVMITPDEVVEAICLGWPCVRLCRNCVNMESAVDAGDDAEGL